MACCFINATRFLAFNLIVTDEASGRWTDRILQADGHQHYPGSIFSVGHERLAPTSSKLFLDGLILIGLAANSDRIPLGFHLAGFVLLAWVMTTVMG